MRKGGESFLDRAWWRDVADKARSGLMLRRFKLGRAAGHTLCLTPAIGTFAELNARDDLKAMNGTQGVMTDVGTWGSNWVVQDGEWEPDGPIQGLGEPEDVIAAPVGTVYEQRDGDATHRVWDKLSGTGSAGWAARVLDPMLAPISTAVQAALTVLGASPHTGVIDSSNVAAGKVGEFFTAELTDGAALALTTTAITSLTSLTLPPGNWEVRGTVVFVGAGATVTSMEIGTAAGPAAIAVTSGRRYAGQACNVSGVTGPVGTLKLGPYELRISDDTPRYLNARATFSAGTVSVYGVLEARRVA